ncbi:hypothetical protein B0H12DRAFT_1160140 [Mycena haematopus]|nr:hypothetical protein B0H12DRAFT_1160140 [Mycena haematopus]
METHPMNSAPVELQQDPSLLSPLRSRRMRASRRNVLANVSRIENLAKISHSHSTSSSVRWSLVSRGPTFFSLFWILHCPSLSTYSSFLAFVRLSPSSRERPGAFPLLRCVGRR